MDPSQEAEFKPGVEDLSQIQTLSGETPRQYQEDEDGYDMSALQTIPLPPPSRDSTPERTEISDYGNEAFLLHNVLSADECDHYIAQGEKLGFEKICGARDDYRNMTRIMLKSPELADLLWSRISCHLEDIVIEGDPHKIHIHGVESLLQGTWKPAYLNQVFRLCRYLPGGHFAPHFDGHLVKNSQVRSMKTFMIYLNGGFDGGTTNFVDELQQLYKDSNGKYCAEEKNIMCRVKPNPGLLIVFNHHRLHEGEAVRNGVKYMIRTDIMFERSGGPTLDPKDEKALQMAQEAERLEGAGEHMNAMELYRKAFKLSPSVAESYGN